MKLFSTSNISIVYSDSNTVTTVQKLECAGTFYAYGKACTNVRLLLRSYTNLVYLKYRKSSTKARIEKKIELMLKIHELFRCVHNNLLEELVLAEPEDQNRSRWISEPYG